jgi:hypothetical protein
MTPDKYASLKSNTQTEFDMTKKKYDALTSTWTAEELKCHNWQVYQPIRRRIKRIISKRRTMPGWNNIHPHPSYVVQKIMPCFKGTTTLKTAMLFSPDILRVKTDHIIY